MISIDKIKKQATILKNFLKESNAEITHSSCLEITAKMHGFKNWNTAFSILNKKEQAIEPSLQKLGFWDKVIYVSESVFLFKYNTGGDSFHNHNPDARELLDVILHHLKDSSLIVKNICPRSFLWDKWSEDRLKSAVKTLRSQTFIHYTYDKDNKLIVSINPYRFWKGDSTLHQEAIDTFNLASYLSLELLPLQNINADITSIIIFSEEHEEWRKQAITNWKTGLEHDEKKSKELLNSLLKNITYSYIYE